MDCTQGFVKVSRHTSYGEVSWTVPVALHECITANDTNRKMKEATEDLDRGLLELDGYKGRPNRGASEEAPKIEETKEEKSTSKRPVGGASTGEKRSTKRPSAGEDSGTKRSAKRPPVGGAKQESGRSKRPVGGAKKEGARSKRPVGGAKKPETVSKDDVNKWIKDVAEPAFISKCETEDLAFASDAEFEAGLIEWLEQDFIRGQITELEELPKATWEEFKNTFATATEEA